MNGQRIAGVMLLVAGLGLQGCLIGTKSSVTYEGNFVSEQSLRSVQPGKSSAAYVMATLGEPTERTSVEPGYEVWKYSYREQKDSAGYIFFIFGGSDSKTTDRAVFIEIKDSIVQRTWRG